MRRLFTTELRVAPLASDALEVSSRSDWDRKKISAAKLTTKNRHPDTASHVKHAVSLLRFARPTEEDATLP